MDRVKIRIDLKTGLYIDVVHPDISGDDIVDVSCPQGLYKPKWNGESWEEGATQEYIDSLKTQATEPPTYADRLDALESAMLEMILGGV